MLDKIPLKRLDQLIHFYDHFLIYKNQDITIYNLIKLPFPVFQLLSWQIQLSMRLRFSQTILKCIYAFAL